jgi:hypothetical protein
MSVITDHRQASRSYSWGRKAAAAAFSVGLSKLKSRDHGRNVKVCQVGGPTNAPDVILPQPSYGLQHPRPSRIVNVKRLVSMVRDRSGASVGPAKLWTVVGIWVFGTGIIMMRTEIPQIHEGDRGRTAFQVDDTGKLTSRLLDVIYILEVDRLVGRYWRLELGWQ